MIEIIVSGAVLAAFSGLAVVAYNHGKLFRKRAVPAAAILIMLTCLWYLVTNGISLIYHSAQSKITRDPEAVAAITQSINRAQNVAWWGFVSVLVTMLYGMFLFFVVTKIKEGDPDKTAEQNPK